MTIILMCLKVELLYLRHSSEPTYAEINGDQQSFTINGKLFTDNQLTIDQVC